MPDDTPRAAAPGSRRDLASRHRHRRPTLLTRSGQAVAYRITALTRPEPDSGSSRTPHLARHPAMTVRRYWT